VYILGQGCAHVKCAACCGAPCCRSCIDTWLLRRAQKSCINCRSPIKSCDLQRDVIRDRLSAAHPRPCAWVDHGCIFVGRRAEVGAHEKNCERIPRSVLRDRVVHLEAATRWQRRQSRESAAAHSWICSSLYGTAWRSHLNLKHHNSAAMMWLGN
jgi:hypothetical protein